MDVRIAVKKSMSLNVLIQLLSKKKLVRNEVRVLSGRSGASTPLVRYHALATVRLQTASEPGKEPV